MQSILVVTAIVAFIASLLLVPLVRKFAIRLNLVDKPDAERKLHSKPIALAGGLAVFVAMLVAFGASIAIDRVWGSAEVLESISGRWFVLLGCAAAILLVGLVDDKWNLRGRQKLLAQCIIAMVMVGSGTMVDQFSVFSWEIQLGIFAIPFSVLWLLLAINALNLLDGADGMATTVGMVICGSLAVLSLQHHPSLSTVAALALCGSLAGFLVFNKPPATIFLGDAGSMMIGLMVGVLSMWCAVKESTLLSAAPIAILVLPLFDSTAAIVRRWMTGRSMYTTDRGHLHHVLHKKFGPQGMLLVVGGACLLSSTVAVLSIHYDQAWMAPAGAAIVLLAFVFTRTFGHSECRLLAGRIWHFVQSFGVHRDRCEDTVHQRCVQLQGDGCWDQVWEPLVEFAKQQGLSRVKIDVNMAWLHEGYHATWQSVRLPEKAFQSVVRIPLFAVGIGGQANSDEDQRVPIGRLEVIAPSKPDSLERLNDFLTHVEELQIQVQHVVSEIDRLSRAPALEAEPSAKPEETLPTHPSAGDDLVREPISSGIINETTSLTVDS